MSGDRNVDAVVAAVELDGVAELAGHPVCVVYVLQGARVGSGAGISRRVPGSFVKLVPQGEVGCARRRIPATSTHRGCRKGEQADKAKIEGGSPPAGEEARG